MELRKPRRILRASSLNLLFFREDWADMCPSWASLFHYMLLRLVSTGGNAVITDPTGWSKDVAILGPSMSSVKRK